MRKGWVVSKFLFSTLFITLCAAPLTCVAQGKAEVKSSISVPGVSKEEAARASQTIYETPPTFTLIPHSSQAHPANVWLRSTEDGLHIWGKVQAGEEGFHWPEEKSGMLGSDHFEIWLAAASDVSMPRVGWGNQFGTTELSRAADCAGQVDPHTGDADSGKGNCERWYNEQLHYRQDLRRLFVRQWVFADTPLFSQTNWFEAFASSAYSDLENNFFANDLPDLLEPTGDDKLNVQVSRLAEPEMRKDAHNAHPYYHQSGYTFHVFIPYTAFPPAQELTLTNLYVMVDVFSAASPGQKTGTYSTTSAQRQWGNPTTFNHIRLAAPPRFSITPCDYKAEEKDLYGTSYPSWFFPTMPDSRTLRTTFALMNPAGGYMYEPSNVSPEISEAKYVWTPLKDGSTVCGPDLAWRRGAAIKATKFSLDEERFETKALADDWSLVRSGPSLGTLSAFGSGQCGACPVMAFKIFAVSPQGEISEALNLDQGITGQGEDPSSADLTISPDWKEIVLYRDFEPEDANSNGWTATKYCLVGHRYAECGKSKGVQPPDPPQFKELRQDLNSGN